MAKKYKNYLLLFASLLFYAWGETQYLLLLLISILANYFFGIVIAKTSLPKESKSSSSSATRFFIITFAITFNLTLLGYFKYANFLIENLNQLLAYFSWTPITFKKVHLPIGISFFTFHAISYLIDIYRQKSKPQKNIFDLALYIAFFPQLIAGPIVRYNFIEKYLNNRRHNLFFIAYGARRFIIGMIKKVIIANPLGEVVDVIFAMPTQDLSTSTTWIGIICYSLQIYFDFSGYSDMAVGLARIFGFKFPENFNYPYISKSIKEFWRRWHMSLSAWFRDYVYIPLGGNRVSLSHQYFNLVLVFFLCGLWHGASWNFIIWGMFHGFFLVFERLKIGQNFLNKLPNLAKNFYTIFVILVGWVFFRSADLTYAINYLKIMFDYVSVANNSLDLARLIRSHFVWMSFAFAIIGFSPLIRNLSLKLIRKNKIFLTIFDLSLLVFLLLAIIRISASTHNPFIYFQF
ncbi:MAG: MBOAT family O-acyltransferase [Rickettsiales bacterium]|nr:MBOAT family O-acyltransferase [Rickettsiales bacterium]